MPKTLSKPPTKTDPRTGKSVRQEAHFMAFLASLDPAIKYDVLWLHKEYNEKYSPDANAPTICLSVMYQKLAGLAETGLLATYTQRIAPTDGPVLRNTKTGIVPTTTAPRRAAKVYQILFGKFANSQSDAICE